MATVATIGYEGTTVTAFQEALREGGVDLLVDVRAVASSRRPGLAKTRLAANVAEIGMEYLHLRGLGTPAEGRSAARAGRHEEMREIFMEHLATPAAQDELHRLADIVRSGRRVCLLCFEADPAHCHRTLVAAALAGLLPMQVRHLFPDRDPDQAAPERGPVRVQARALRCGAGAPDGPALHRQEEVVRPAPVHTMRCRARPPPG